MKNLSQKVARALIFADDIKKAVNTVFVSQDVIKAAIMLSESNHKIVTTGMGKAGHIARKSASTLASLGMPSCFIHPGEAAHGDLGMIKDGDVLLVFSTSGKTREVIETIDRAKKLGEIKIIAITSHPDATIRGMVDVVIDIGFFEEAGYLNLAPTTSTVMMLIYSDMIATMAADMRDFTVEDFSIRHHGGYLGQKCRGEI
ncbi:MAG: SIS domain-containing protein [Candidatus Cloacimonetes bacterium]|jgi:arabinose-5-phosphate isomerase|nr:SIS domain-containing protein [Candidatus Cloacimonadota bacterium]